MTKQETKITYEVSVTRTNGEKYTAHKNDGKLGISHFKDIINEERKEDATAQIECFRLVDGKLDGDGVIMRSTQKGNGIGLPQGRYNKVDTSGSTPTQIEFKATVVSTNTKLERN